VSKLSAVLVAITMIFVLPACVLGWAFWRIIRNARSLPLQNEEPGEVAMLSRIDGAMAELEGLDELEQWIG